MRKLALMVTAAIAYAGVSVAATASQPPTQKDMEIEGPVGLLLEMPEAPSADMLPEAMRQA